VEEVAAEIQFCPRMETMVLGLLYNHKVLWHAFLLFVTLDLGPSFMVKELSSIHGTKYSPQEMYLT
jgi:hypothetical protein